MSSVIQDLKYGLRILTRTPSFTAIAILTLAIGIGASTAVVAVVNASLLKPLPYSNPERILMLWRMAPAGAQIGYSELPWNRYDYLEFQRNARSLEAVGAFKADSFNLTGITQPLQLSGLRATAGFFAALGVNPILGRTYTAAEDQPGRSPVVVLSEAVWQNQFGRHNNILGRTLDLNGVPHTVIGVMPAGFAFPRAEEMPASFNFPRQIQLWVPAALNPGGLIPAETSDYAVIARLKPDMSLAQAQSDLDAHERAMEAMFPSGAKGWFHTVATPLMRQVSAETRRPLMFLFSAVIVVLLIACSNVAGLLLARSTARQREFTLRLALGSPTGRLTRQLLTESLLLGLAGGIVGLGMAKIIVELVLHFGPANIPRLHETTLAGDVFVFAIGASVLTSLLFGLAPALSVRKTNLLESLKQTGPRTIGGGVRKLLLVAEFALAMVLVVATGLIVRTFQHLLSVDPGFQSQSVLTFELSLPQTKYPDSAAEARLYTSIREKLRAVPGVESAGIVETVPMAGATEASALRIPEHNQADPRDIPFANYTVASPGYFRAVGTRLLRGRDFLDSDNADTVPVTIINNAMAKKYWPNQDPIGKQVAPRSKKYPLASIIGIVADVKHLSLRDEPQPEMYVLYTQKVYPSLLVMNVVLRARMEPGALAESARAAVQSVDPDLPLAKVETLREVVEDSMTSQRFAMQLLTAFGVLALVMAAVGLYGLVSYFVAQRTQEIGVRMALGAGRNAVFRMVLGQGARLALLGMAIGTVAAMITARAMTPFLYGVRAYDPLTLSSVSLLLLGVAVLACVVPAYRATRVDPMAALRYE